ncbi:LCP family protein [Nocardioides lianchengensis]|uniref:Cell envelope-related function transcriptional attenuator common domain-containing protein n=1 Tax=Nocardioides lianchengensis TaxID=1045774 RepID=A0A1G6VRI2_9ACTN|nr:LCP family protein [Nocardioides lianchengensis]NYG11270.1 LCP family protein required for cell wall assembly [Nocardioides lianchengensis]SDD56178.1 cell envelope-related function transcriptional attenuator common domain-containing protein [Nocardioides lianchengensis]
MSPVEREDRRRDRRALLGLLVCTALVTALVAGTVVWAQSKIPRVRHTEPAFAGLTDRPARVPGPAGGALNLLLLGTDRRSDVPTTGEGARAAAWEPGEQRTDTMMLVHVAADRRSVQVVSLPRDSWVRVPGHGRAKINAAYSLGGLPRAVETVETLTGVRLDHVAVVDWSGFRALADLAGGVRVRVPETVVDSIRDTTWTAGEHLLSGDEALAYVGQRYGLPGGDLDRVRRQQAVLRALLTDSLHAEMRKDPEQSAHFVTEVLRHVAVDETWSLTGILGFCASLRDLRTADVRFLTAPVAGLGREGAQSVVHLDRPLGRELWAAVRDDVAATWLDRHPDLETGDVVR